MVQVQFNGSNGSRLVGPIRDARYGYKRMLTKQAKELGWANFDVNEADYGREHGFSCDWLAIDQDTGFVLEVIRV